MSTPPTTATPLAAAPPPTVAAFRAWLDRAAPGDRLAYHRGLLTRDRAPRSALPEPHRRRLDALAAAALAAAGAGRVHLVQRRHGRSDFAYLAIKAGTAARVRPDAARPARPAPSPLPAAA